MKHSGNLWCVTLLILASFAPVNGQGQGPPRPSAPPPRLTCSLIDEKGVEQPPVRKHKVSNLQRVQLRVKLSGTGLPLEPLTLKKGGAAGEGTVEFTAHLVSGSQKTSVPVKAIQVGGGMELGQVYMTALLEFPVEEAKRRENIDAYLRKIEENSRKAGREAEFKHLARDREAAVAAFGGLYVDNRVGEIEVTCRYTSKRRGFWNGEVKSFPPVRLQVVFEGNFFEQPGFRL